VDWPQLIDELNAGATVVTANDRLARALAQAVAEHNVARGLTVWETPKALTLAALLDQQSEALAASGDPSARRCIEPHEADALWERIIEDSIARVLREQRLLQLRALARSANEARGIVLRHRFAPGPLAYPVGENALDAREFRRWHEVYAKRLDELNATDAAALPDLIAAAWSRELIRPPERVIFTGFDEFTPQGMALIDALRSVGVRVSTPVPLSAAAPEGAPPNHATRVVLDDACGEIERAAAWAAALLAEAPGRRLGLVVPDLQKHRQTVIDALDAMLAPDAMVLGGAASGAPRYNLSLGRPLGAWPLIADALRLLALTHHEVEWRDASVVLRSPFFALDADRAAELELWLRDQLPERFALEALARGVEAREEGAGADAGATRSDAFLSRLVALRPEARDRRVPSAWVGHASAVLEAAGWPGPRALDGAERQTLGKWDAALRSACRLDAALGPIVWSRFCERLAAIVDDTDFQPQAGPSGALAPIQVLGYLEGAVLSFDALWVMGMDDESWPPAARPNPLLPLALQVEAIAPGASAAERLVHAQRITARLLAAAPKVVVSSPAHEGDAEHRPSPLIAHLAVRDPSKLPAFVPIEHHWGLAQATERFADAPVPLVVDGVTRGGTSLIQHQAACPFRAFAQHRLGAEALAQPTDATDAAARGSLVHEVLHRVWDELEDKATLDAATPEHLAERVKQHVIAAIGDAAREAPSQWPLRLKALEQERLVARILEWLAVERERAPFAVQETEQWHALAVGGLLLKGKIDRIDEVLLDGEPRPVYIDYKTGAVDWRRWLGARPQDPQLPLYAVALADRDGGEAAGVLFAKVRVGDHGFAGVAAEAGLAPGAERWPPEKPRGDAVKGALFAAPDWSSLKRYWRENLGRLAAEFTAGVATVTPERDACRHCHLQALCRIDELGGVDEADAAEPGDA